MSETIESEVATFMHLMFPRALLKHPHGTAPSLESIRKADQVFLAAQRNDLISMETGLLLEYALNTWPKQPAAIRKVVRSLAFRFKVHLQKIHTFELAEADLPRS